MKVGISQDTLSKYIPGYALQTDAAADLRACLDRPMTIYPHCTAVIPTGLRVRIPNGYVGLVCSRSGLAAKKDLAVLNAPGVIDTGYTDQVKVILHNFGIASQVIQPGDRIAQMMFQKIKRPTFVYITEDEMTRDDRGGGLGSTGDA